MAIFDLVEAVNDRARKVTAAYDKQDLATATSVSATPSAIDTLNRILASANLPITIKIESGQKVVASRSEGPDYDVAQLSDGERNILLLAATVLTCRPGTLLLLDEPERHVHRSIITPFINMIINERSDCAFIVSTHDIGLATDMRHAQKLLLRECIHHGDNMPDWRLDLIPGNTPLDDQIMQDVLGARRQVVFVEGSSGSLDQPLYAALLPSVSVIAKANCRAVQNSVKAIREADNLHWVQVFGIIDRDGRGAEEIEGLKSDGIYAVHAYSVEGIYYHPDMQELMAKRTADRDGSDPATLVQAAKKNVLEALRGHVDRLSARRVEFAVRDVILSSIPTHRKLMDGGTINIEVDIDARLREEKVLLQAAMDEGDLKTILSRYPVRETGILIEIAKAIGYEHRKGYERAFLHMIRTDDSARDIARSFLCGLYEEVVATQVPNRAPATP